MKKIFMLLMFVVCPAFAITSGTVNKSSFTLTNDSSKCIAARELDKVIVGSASGVGAIILVNSTFTVTGSSLSVQVSSISLNTPMSYDFNDLLVRGICYSTTGNTAGVTILYK